MGDRMRYVLALMVGLVAIPGLALATNSALSSGREVEDSGVVAETTPSTMAAESAAISAEDLVRACGVEGHYLVDLEAVGAIDEIQQAALNALRPICEDAGLALPPAPVVEGETIVETVTVVRRVPGPAPAIVASTTTSIPTTTTAEGAGSPEATSTTSTTDGAAGALEAREQALTAIQTAIDVEGKVEKINEAIGKVEKGDAAYEGGDYDKAREHYEEAEHKAVEAQREPEEHEDHEEEDD